METPNEDRKPPTPLSAQVVLCVGALGLMLACMYFSATYVLPSGKTLDLEGFVVLWLKEIVLLAVVTIGLVIGLSAWLIQLLRRIAATRKMRSNPSIEVTASSGLRPPPAAPHVKR